ncbi:MAG: hypothetical protein ACD_69C00009G0002 [uncultured bacterium]|nr:MAG: hypothetical protein ACD_69C00009G0002 [uncultured bacterium]OGT09136.1 MAG: hypothetical protein A2V89_04370 [Gammaproteobacteria bacterium RBG_16_37_9]HBY55203.1 23S rRNA (adenine(2030)-N(6))-methyltransferase RlmJ [Coxiellaceae bacterium]
MNYRHIYHAGNFADVFKHCILIMLMQSLSQKDKAISYLDTHAGIGLYDLTSENAQKTREYENGIARLYNLQDYTNCPEVINTYLQIVRAVNNGKDIIDRPNIGAVTLAASTIYLPKFYPGSPYIMRSLLRSQDYITLVEMHPEDVLALKQEFQKDKQVAVHHLDGYQSMKAFLPPKNGRGLILIDPAYEQKDEMQNIIAAMQIALDRFSVGIYAIWYPIKDQEMIQSFYKDLKQLAAQNILITGLSVGEDASAYGGLTSCGMAIINAPWQFEKQLKPMVAWLSRILVGDSIGKHDVRWLLHDR